MYSYNNALTKLHAYKIKHTGNEDDDFSRILACSRSDVGENVVCSLERVWVVDGAMVVVNLADGADESFLCRVVVQVEGAEGLVGEYHHADADIVGCYFEGGDNFSEEPQDVCGLVESVVVTHIHHKHNVCLLCTN